MPDAFKLLLSPPLVRLAGAHFGRVLPRFARARFEALALDGFEALEMKARAMRIADALEATLPGDFARAAAAIEAALAPVRGDEALGELRAGEAGLAGWIVWPLGEYVARRGLEEPARALACLRELTQRFSAEFAIRPFLLAHPQHSFDTLAAWTTDPSPHVRRLVSEGSRPRLPWGILLKPLVADPTPTLPLLGALQDDASDYVRRSVANHLNDIAKDHPAVVADWLERHLPGASRERRALLRHASRTLVKRGNRRVLAAWGLDARLRGTAVLSVAPPRIRLGETLTIELALASSARTPQTLAIDYVVHHVRADGSTSPKVFKGWSLVLGAGEQRVLLRRHPVRPITTRRYYPGVHRIAVQVNGQVVAEADFVLRA
ncbi:MAG: DNA alkylation repair protein [Xanthomonadaceae bacterium]|jgi:3-methyladenine DNA glycosylase AlkC|nr:DNA alkylation repair protein [Xanthomonadaceae bacterium]